MINKKFWLSIVLTAGLTVMAVAQTTATDALEGLDPVLLVQGKEVQGDLKTTVTRGQFRYMFANEANKAAFEKDPARYEIQLGGACARMGAPTNGIADLYAVQQGRIYIFGSEQCKKLFVAAPEKYLSPEHKAVTATPEMLKKGQALFEKAVAALGGTAKLDGLTSYHEKNTSTQTRGARGEVEVKNDLLLAYPDRARVEVAMPDFNDVSVMMRRILVLQPTEPFVVTTRGVLPLQAPLRLEQEQQFQRQPLGILRARAQFKAAYTGAGKAGESPVEQVALELAGVPATLGFDPATGRLLSLAYKRRGPQGNFGDFVQTFSDFRTVDGLTLPFKITATFDGQPWKDQSATIESISLNGAVDPKLFEKPQVKQ
ncbi:MAG: hypothetical protein HYR56_04120 [Acidobacteria bacterium]|nr:hypothetical protein [Acidobacteriota bacterium]MBI3426584.1 hypothetical protein [Acidobacteriota bacterium]